MSALGATAAMQRADKTIDDYSAWVDATFTARRFGIEGRVVVSWGV